ncbi:hypothetical protein [Achromobacter kerstersii]|uniref:hypothetical protein n=1 Tax=Achromobacter kerstersii TaxID=1353890 RepID=UPI003208B162
MMDKNRSAILGLIVAYGLLLLVAAVWSWKFTAPEKGFAELFAVWVAALTSGLGAAVSFIVLSSQRNANSELEKLKGNISKSVNSELELLKGEINKSVNSELELLKGEIGRGLKLVDFSMGQVARASEVVSAAMSNYYYAFATLEYGAYDERDAQAAEMSMRQAHSRLLDLLPDARDTFEDFWQVGANIQGELRKMRDGNDRLVEMKQIWRNYVRDFGGKIKAAEAALMTSREKAREGTL